LKYIFGCQAGAVSDARGTQDILTIVKSGTANFLKARLSGIDIRLGPSRVEQPQRKAQRHLLHLILLNLHSRNEMKDKTKD